MKTKLTVTVDDKLLPRAKAAARRRGVSLSLVIETALKTLVEPGRESFVNRWRGAFRPSKRHDVRYRALAARADRIVTRNLRDFARSPVKAVTPAAALRLVSRPAG